MKTTAAQTAQVIRKELKQSFPDIVFSVRSENFTGGNAVNIDYTDGPRIEEVEKIVRKYEYGQFDGMQDLYEYTNVRKDIPQVKYIMVYRQMSKETEQKIIDKVSNHYVGWNGLNGWNENFRCWGSTLVNREFNEMNL